MEETIKISEWAGKEENLQIEYNPPEIIYDYNDFHYKVTSENEEKKTFEYDGENIDYIIAASIGILTGMLDVFWVGEFSIEKSSTWGNDKVNRFVIFVAKKIGYNGDDLKGAILYLEKNAKIPSDSLTSRFGGGLKHHIRDFAHHLSLLGLVFSILTQFTKMCYGIDENGNFVIVPLQDDKLIGNSFYSKIIYGTINWFIHLVSDMAGTSKNAGQGTGIPGPILSLAIEIGSVLKISNDDSNSNIIVAKLELLFAGKICNEQEIAKFDLRTEIGVIGELTKQSVPVYINRGLVKSFYIIKSITKYLKKNNITGFDLVNSTNFLTEINWNTKCFVRMCTISSGVFSIIDCSNAFIVNKIQGKSFYAILFRINFIGLVSFVVSIKNDIQFSIDNLVNKKIILCNANEIKIDAFYCTEELYKLTFDNIYNNICKQKEATTERHRVNNNIEKSIYILKDDSAEIFDEIAKYSYFNIMYETELLIMKLMKNKGINFIPLDEKFIKLNDRPFYRIENNEKVLYVFTWSIMTYCGDYKNLRETLNVYDKIKLIALVETGIDNETPTTILDWEDKKNGVYGKIQRGTLRALFSQFFDDNEYLNYKNELAILNNKIRGLIGYSTVTIPSERALFDFKNESEQVLLNYNYKEVFNEFYESQYISILENYKKNYLYVLGNNSFSQSFISSEWYFKQHIATNGIEQTAIIAGYLKSIEQLLYQICLLTIDKGYLIKSKGGKDLVEFTTINLNSDLVDLTFGSLINYIMYNKHSWLVNSYIKRIVINRLTQYRIDFRNDHFHKDNIFVIEEITTIRKKTIELYFLLLGSIDLSNNAFSKFENKSLTEKISIEKEFEDWLSSLIGGYNLLDPHIGLLFFITKSSIMLQTYTGSNDKTSPDIDLIGYPFSGNNFNYDKDNYNKVVSSIASWVTNYSNNGKYNDIFNFHKNIFVYSPESFDKIK